MGPSNRHDVVAKGQAIYERNVRSQVEAVHAGKFVVLDVETGDFEVDVDKLVALNRLLARPKGCRTSSARAVRQP